MDIGLSGKKALVTGGSRGIGRGIVLALARAGVDVVTCHRQDSPAVDSLAAELKDLGGEHAVLRADVTRPAEIARLVDECGTRFGRLDLVVHNAGAISHVPFAELPDREWHRVLDTNLTAAFELVQRSLPLLSPGASVVAVGSRVASVGVPLRAHYTASKAALVGMVRSLSKELGPRGVRLNVVAPGPVETETPVPAAVLERYSAMIPLGRLGRPDEIAGAVLFLASPLSSFVNGATLDVDGGI